MDVSSARSMILYEYVEHNFLKSSIFDKQTVKCKPQDEGKKNKVKIKT